MKKTLDARLLALESIESPDSSRLLILGRYEAQDSDVIGLRGGDARLPADVLRLPGETVETLHARAAAMVSGAGPLLLGVLYRDAAPLV